jgi:hypothetical protein
LHIAHSVQFRAEVCDRGALRVIRLAGRLDREQASDLIGLCDRAPKPLQLDLCDLVSADAVGFATLGMLRRRGIGLVAVSPYVAMQLEFEHANHARELETSRRDRHEATQSDNTTDTEDR